MTMRHIIAAAVLAVLPAGLVLGEAVRLPVTSHTVAFEADGKAQGVVVRLELATEKGLQVLKAMTIELPGGKKVVAPDAAIAGITWPRVNTMSVSQDGDKGVQTLWVTFVHGRQDAKEDAADQWDPTKSPARSTFTVRDGVLVSRVEPTGKRVTHSARDGAVADFVETTKVVWEAKKP